MSALTFETHANRAARVAEEGQAIFWTLIDALRVGAREAKAEGDVEGSKDTSELMRKFANWWAENAECMDDIAHDVVRA